MTLHVLGIDFGTTYSSMATLDPASGRAMVLRNAEGEEKTPSLVYFGADGTLVGTPAQNIMLEDEEEAAWVFTVPKRYLGDGDFVRALPDGRVVTAVDAVAAILTKLREDAEALHFGGPVGPVVLTCPASFGPSARDALREAAARAGLGDVRLVEEPVAAGHAGLRDQGQRLGNVVLVYDLGGGTFDAAVVRRVEDGYRVVVAPRGLDRCGGEDFDRSVYRWFDGAAREEHGRSFDASDGSFNSPVLRACRMAKEALSSKPKVTLRGFLAEQRHKQDLDQATLEGLIDERIAATVRLSKDLADAADRRGHAVEHVLLIGGSSRIPLVTRQIIEALTEPRGLPEPLRLGATDFAVVMGAVYALVALDDMAPSAGSPRRVRAPGTVFRDVDALWCPEMVVLPRGRFQMGSPEDEPDRDRDEGPRHWVEIGYDLAIGTCAVSFAEWDAYAPRGSGRYYPFDEGWGRDDRPVINVSYGLVQHYLWWLNDRLGLTGREDRYRLPSEAEWEFACRGGAKTQFWWGRNITTRQANYDGNYIYGDGSRGDYRKKTVPVRSFAPNPFGLYQMHGNVWEWCEDAWHGNYEGAPADGSARAETDIFFRGLRGGSWDFFRILRGGSWDNSPRNLRSANRYRNASDTRNNLIGFRVARTLIS